MKKMISILLAVMMLVLCMSVSAVSVFANETEPPTSTEVVVTDVSDTNIPEDMVNDVVVGATEGATVPADVFADEEKPTTGGVVASTDVPTVAPTYSEATGDEAGKLSTDVQTGAGTPIVFAVIAVLAIIAGGACFIGFKKSKASK